MQLSDWVSSVAQCCVAPRKVTLGEQHWLLEAGLITFELYLFSLHHFLDPLHRPSHDGI